MKSVSLKFASIESLSRFALSLECGYCINMAALSAKGYFAADTVERAIAEFGAQEEEGNEVVMAKNANDWL